MTAVVMGFGVASAREMMDLATDAPVAAGQTAGAGQAPAGEAANSEQGGSQAGVGSLFIREIRIKGATKLPTGEVEEAVYPYLGPGRSEADVEQARAALEKAYQDKGFQTVSVSIPQQEVRGRSRVSAGGGGAGGEIAGEGLAVFFVGFREEWGAVAGGGEGAQFQ